MDTEYVFIIEHITVFKVNIIRVKNMTRDKINALESLMQYEFYVLIRHV